MTMMERMKEESTKSFSKYVDIGGKNVTNMWLEFPDSSKFHILPSSKCISSPAYEPFIL